MDYAAAFRKDDDHKPATPLVLGRGSMYRLLVELTDAAEQARSEGVAIEISEPPLLAGGDILRVKKGKLRIDIQRDSSNKKITMKYYGFRAEQSSYVDVNFMSNIDDVRKWAEDLTASIVNKLASE